MCSVLIVYPHFLLQLNDPFITSLPWFFLFHILCCLNCTNLSDNMHLNCLYYLLSYFITWFHLQTTEYAIQTLTEIMIGAYLKIFSAFLKLLILHFLCYFSDVMTPLQKYYPIPFFHSSFSFLLTTYLRCLCNVLIHV